MKNTVFSYIKKLSDYIKNLNKKKRNMYLIIFGVSILATTLAIFVLNHKEYVILYSNLDTKECASIAGKLDEMKIAYKVENEKTIYVEKSSEPKVKLQLASEGYPKSALNYDIFTKNIDFMTTDYEKTKYNLFLLQERLQSSIKTLDNVKDAIVTISLPDNSMAVLDKDKIAPSASVVLNLTSNVVLSAQQINGIELLVAKSVPGLTIKNISIIDQSSKILNEHSEDDVSATTSNRVKTENEFSNTISKKISDVLEPLYGKGNISIGVNVNLDYSKKITEKTSYTPAVGNNGVVDSYQQSYEGAGTGATAAAGGVPGTESNSEIPGYQTQAGKSNQNAKSDVSVKYYVNQMKEQVQKDGAEIKDITVSVLLNKKNMSAEESDRITRVIANASGIAKEKVELLSTEFITPSKPVIKAEAPKALNLLSERFILIYIIVALVVVMIIIQIKFKRKKKAILKEAFADEKAPPKKDFINELSSISKISESKEEQLSRELREFSIKSPHITAQLIKTLLKGDSD